MERISFIKHNFKDILMVDISNIRNVEESIAVLEQAIKMIKTQAPKSILLLTNVTGTHYDKEGAEAMKRYSSENTPFIKASAVVGVSGIKRLVLNAVVRMTGRTIMTFDEVDQAKEWLSQQ
jgi:hypothetical protein